MPYIPRRLKLSRRAMLGGAGALIALPWLEAMSPLRGRKARAAGGDEALRLLCYYLPNGLHMQSWTPQAQGAGYHATVVEEYLADHPVPAGDIVHVEDGAWVNADGDFGSPQFLNWNWPLMGASGVDIANGWAEDERNFAVIVAATNWVVSAEDAVGS